MTPKEKAKEIIMKMSFETHAYNAKHCALIAVDEILKTTPPYCDRYEEYYMKLNENQKPEYWDQVNQEIEKL
jgi:hypothetical protein